MSTTFATLEADPTLMRQANSDILTESRYSDQDLINLNKDLAKAELKADLCDALRFVQSDTNDMELLDQIVDKYSANLQRALSYKQLFLFYFQTNDGEGSKTQIRMKYYQNLYDDEKNKFINYSISNYSSARMVNVIRG